MRYILLFILSLIFLSCGDSNPERDQTPYSSGDNKVNSLFAEPGETSKLVEVSSEPITIKITKENKDTAVQVYRQEARTLTYYVPVIDTFTIKYAGEVKPTDPEPPKPDPTVRTNIIYDDMFESADPKAKYTDQKQWCCNYSVTSSDKIVREGTRSVRMEHRGSDPKVSSGERVEFQSDAYFKKATETWVGYSIYFENWGACSGCGEHINQYHPSSSSGSAVYGIYTNNNTWHVRLNPEGDASAYTLKDGLKIVSNRWHDVVQHIVWSSDKTRGRIELWIDGEKYIDFTGVTLTTSLPYAKFGLNGWFYTGSTTRVFHLDALRIGSEKATYKDVAP